MIRTQIQLPNPLYRKMKSVASARDWSLAELVRRGMESYVETCPEAREPEPTWILPVLRPSGGMIKDPAASSVEADAVMDRWLESSFHYAF